MIHAEWGDKGGVPLCKICGRTLASLANSNREVRRQHRIPPYIVQTLRKKPDHRELADAIITNYQTPWAGPDHDVVTDIEDAHENLRHSR